MADFSIKIPVTDYEYQLLSVMLGESPFKVSYKNTFGKILLSSFCRKMEFKPKPHILGTRFYELQFSTRWVVRYGAINISDESIKDFIAAVDDIFKQRLYDYIDGALDLKQNYKKRFNQDLVAKMKTIACDFLEKYGFNEETLKFETVKKGYQRYKGEVKTFARVA